MGDLAVEQQPQPLGMAERRRVASGFQFAEGLRHAEKSELVELVERRVGEQQRSPWGLMVVARPADVGVEQRDIIDGRSRRRSVELVIEDRAHRAIGQGADLDGSGRCGFEASDAERPHQADDTETGAEALFRMRPALKDQIAKGSGGRADRSGGAANAFNGPIGVAPVARRHMLGKGGVPMVGAAAPMRRDPLTLEKDLDDLRRQPHLDLVARKAVRDAVKMSLDLDMVIDTDTWAFSPRA